MHVLSYKLYEKYVLLEVELYSFLPLKNEKNT